MGGVGVSTVGMCIGVTGASQGVSYVLATGSATPAFGELKVAEAGVTGTGVGLAGAAWSMASLPSISAMIKGSCSAISPRV